MPASEVRNGSDEEVSPRGGLVYKPRENVSLYAAYSQTFLPRSGEQYANINGNNDDLSALVGGQGHDRPPMGEAGTRGS